MYIMTDKRITELETKVAYQEHTIQELNDVIYRQQQQIDEIEIKCQHLMDRIQSLAETGAGDQPANDRPPHY